MSDFSSAEVLVPGLNQFYVADVGEPFPTSIDDPIAGEWLNLGYFNTDGLKVSFERKSDRVMADQSFDPLRIIITEVPKMITLSLLQWNTETLRLGMGGGDVTVAGSGFHYEPPEESFVDERAVLLSMTDGERNYRIGYYKAMNQAKLDTNFTRSKASELPLEMVVLAADDGSRPFFIDTDDPAFTVTASA